MQSPTVASGAPAVQAVFYREIGGSVTSDRPEQRMAETHFAEIGQHDIDAITHDREDRDCCEGRVSDRGTSKKARKEEPNSYQDDNGR